ncbi:MAG: DUF2490 domain-containing protein [Bacteroidia bacterium]
MQFKIKNIFPFLKRLLLFVVTTLISCYNCSAQQKDFEGIFSINLEKKISRSFSIGVLQQNAFNQNLNELGYWFLEAGLDYRLTRNFTLSGAYRYMERRNRGNFYHTRQLLIGDFTYSKSVKRFSFSMRARFQNMYYGDLLETDYRAPKLYNRDRFTLRYKINYYLAPYISTEIFFPLNNPVNKSMNQVRGTIGFFYQFNERFKTEIYYQVQQQLNVKNKYTYYVLSLNLYYKL